MFLRTQAQALACFLIICLFVDKINYSEKNDRVGLEKRIDNFARATL